jgi:(p)ppGpp synthase/HD superfamily hydrolase
MKLTQSNSLLEIIGIIASALQQSKIRAKISYRLKHPSSIFKKMARHSIELHKVRDIVAFRFVVRRLEDCYMVANIIKRIYTANLIDQKDYIAKPKENGYRSLHIVLSDNELIRNFEIQIRTHRMHTVAELGSASHSGYKADQDTKCTDPILHSKLLSLINSAKKRNSVYNIWHKFQWTIPELNVYEKEIKKIWNRCKSNLLSKKQTN